MTKKPYTPQPFQVLPSHGRYRTYWRAKSGTWSCGHIHHSPETAAECAAKLNGYVAGKLKKASTR